MSETNDVSVPDPISVVVDAVARGEVDLAQAFGLHPLVLEKMVERALALARAGKVEPGIAILEDVQRVDTTSAMVPFLLGTLFAKHGEPTRAINAYEVGLARSAGDALITARIRLCLGHAFWTVGQIERAKSVLESISNDVDPNSARQAGQWLQHLGGACNEE